WTVAKSRLPHALGIIADINASLDAVGLVVDSDTGAVGLRLAVPIPYDARVTLDSVERTCRFIAATPPRIQAPRREEIFRGSEPRGSLRTWSVFPRDHQADSSPRLDQEPG